MTTCSKQLPILQSKFHFDHIRLKNTGSTTRTTEISLENKCTYTKYLGTSIMSQWIGDNHLDCWYVGFVFKTNILKKFQYKKPVLCKEMSACFRLWLNHMLLTAQLILFYSTSQSSTFYLNVSLNLLWYFNSSYKKRHNFISCTNKMKFDDDSSVLFGYAAFYFIQPICFDDTNSSTESFTQITTFIKTSI